MIHNIKRYLLTLVALLAMTTGAWADETPLVTIESKDYVSFTSGSKTFDNIATVTFSSEVSNYGDGDGWTSVYGVTLSVTPVEGIVITRVKFTCEEGSAFDETAPFEAVLGEGDPYYNPYMIVNGNSYGGNGVTKIEVYGTAEPPIEVSYNATFTEASFTMPAYDATVSYELVRDMTVGVDLNLLIDQQPVTRARIARVGDGPYQLQGNWQFAAIDNLDPQNPVSLTNGELIYTLKKKDGNEYVAVNTSTDLAPGLWRLEATAIANQLYEGTIYSADIELYAAYDLYISPAQDENVSVTVNDAAVSPDAEGKISEVKSGNTVKLNVTNADYIIRKAAVKGATVSYKVESQFTNGNNYGASTDLKTVLESTSLPVTIKLSDAISFPWDKASEKITNIVLQSWGSNPATLSEFSKDGEYVVNPGDVTITFNSLIGATSNTSLLTVSFEGDNGSPQDNNYDIKLSLNQ